MFVLLPAGFDLGELCAGLVVEVAEVPVDRLHDAAVPAAALQCEAIAQLAVFMFQLADLVAVALIGIIDLFLVTLQQGELAVLFGDEAGRAGEAPIAFDGSVDLRLRGLSVLSSLVHWSEQYPRRRNKTYWTVHLWFLGRIDAPGWNVAGDTITQRLRQVWVHAI